MNKKPEAFDETGNWKPLEVIGSAALIAGISLIAGLVIPALIAHHGGVFYEKDMLLIDSLVNRKAANPDIRLVPFFLNVLMYTWVIMYTVLGWLIFFMPRWQKELKKPSSESIKTAGLKIIGIATGIYIMWEWSLWVRNFVLDEESRIIYAFANYDVYKGSFFAQEVNVFIFAVLLAVVWQQWSWFFMKRRTDVVDDPEEDYCKKSFDYSRMRRLSKTFIQWQIASLLLAPGFIGFSSGYWDFVVASKDHRYILAAVIIHILWAITWILISLPLLITWYDWRSARVRALSELAEQLAKPRNTVETRIKILAEMQPIGFWNAATSGSLASVTFVLPIVQAFVQQSPR